MIKMSIVKTPVWALLTICLLFLYLDNRAQAPVCLQPVIAYQANQPVLSVPCGYDRYQWYRNNTLMQGATEPTLRPTTHGSYHVRVTCTTQPFRFSTVGIEPTSFREAPFGMEVFPNPANQQISVVLTPNHPNVEGHLQLHDALGQLRYEQVVALQNGIANQIQIPVGALPAGSYVLTFFNATQRMTRKVFLQ